jgi:hypothetical protein
MIHYLQTGELPDEERLRKAVMEDKDHPPSSFVLEKDSLLYRKTDTGQAPYLAPGIRMVYLERIHREYGHLGWPGLNGVLKNRAWWPSIEQDVKRQIGRCPECQVAKGPQKGQTRGPGHTLEREDIKLFDQWSIDLIGLLPRTYKGNRWIITAIERSTGWPVVRAVKEATSQTVMNFIHDEIFSVYGIPNEILTDNGTNLVSEAVETFFNTAKLKHRTTTPYHPQTNGKVERFNGTIGKMLTKYLYGKPVRMWDEYLRQAVFATRIRLHAISKYSPFFLLYGVDPKLPDDPLQEVPNDAEAKIELILERHRISNEARLAANKALVEKAIKAQLVRDEHSKQAPDIKVGSYVLVRDEYPRKLHPTWFGPYKIAMAAPIGTYALEDCNGKIVRSLIHGNRLITLNPTIVDERTGKWKSSYNADKIREKYEVIPPSDEISAALDRDSIPGFTYKDLATVTKREWLNMQSRGLDSSKLGEGKVGDTSFEEHIFQKLRARVEANERKQEKEAQQEEAIEDETIATALPERVSHSLDQVVPLQASTATSQSTPPAQADVPMEEESPRKGPLPSEQVRGEGILVEEETEVYLPTRTEAGRHKDSIVEDLQPSNNDPPTGNEISDESPKSASTRKQRKKSTNLATTQIEQDRDTRTGYSLRRKPEKAKPKEERAVRTKTQQ